LHDCAQALSSRFFVTNIQKLLVTDLIVTSSFFRPKATKAFIVVFVALPSEFQLDHPNINVVYTGVGKVNAAIMATKTLPIYDPEDTLVYNYGSAGSKTLVKNLQKLYSPYLRLAANVCSIVLFFYVFVVHLVFFFAFCLFLVIFSTT
jgi:hypothetical protein